MPILLIECWLNLCICIRMIVRFICSYQRKSGYFQHKKISTLQNTFHRQQRKPEWVTQEIIRLKALMVHDGCRKIADTFNRLYSEKREMTVGKTFVYETLKKHQYEVKVLRRKIKNKRPHTLPKNRLWAMDLTQVTDAEKQLHTIFGIIDSGTRACVHLQQIRNKASITLLRHLLDTIEHFGKPKMIRTDNEAVFTSQLFRFGLWLLGIKHQRTEVCCPWMNGKIERFIGTFKQKLKHHVFSSADTLVDDLVTFRFWYNIVQPHQHLNGFTPAEIWSKQKFNTDNPIEFSAWNGALAGIYFSPS